MTQSGFLNEQRLALPRAKKAAVFLTWRNLILVTAAGVISAVLGQYLGRTLHLAKHRSYVHRQAQSGFAMGPQKAVSAAIAVPHRRMGTAATIGRRDGIAVSGDA